MINYHELTMNEPRDSPARRKQFLIICTVMAAVFLNTTINSGVFSPVVITEGIFPGGEFVYKPVVKDYAAGMGLLRAVASDLGIDIEANDEHDDLLYAVFIDDATKVPGGKSRFMGGPLLTESQSDMRRTLLATNVERRLGGGGEEGNEEAAAIEVDDNGHFASKIPYEVGSLPSVDAAVAQFPFTNGFVSALVASNKVIPALRKYAEEHGEKGNKIVVSTTCSIEHEMCTHYAPLLKGEDFHLGRPDTETYAKEFEGGKGGINFGNVMRGLKKMNPFK